MTLTDPIADMLTRLRNAVHAGHKSVQMPSSKLKVAIAEVLREEGYIKSYQVLDEQPQPVLKIELQYLGKKESVLTGLKRVSKPGLRVYRQTSALPRVFGGLGIAIVSTPQGVMTGQRARQLGVGGEVLCYVW